MNKHGKKITLTLFFTLIFLISCTSDNTNIETEYHIDPNTISLETLNGQWDITHSILSNGELVKTGDEIFEYLSFNCPEKPTYRYITHEYSLGIKDGIFYEKLGSTEEKYLYESSECDALSTGFRLDSNIGYYHKFEITDSIAVKDNKIYFEIREENNNGGYYYYQNRFTFENDRILCAFIDHLGRQESIEAMTLLDFKDFNIIQKTSETLNLANFNDGLEGVFFIDF